MSFGFSVGDFLAVLQICKTVYSALQDGPEEYKELQGEMKSLRYAIQSLSDDAKDPNSLLNRKGSGRKAELMDVIANCERTMREMRDLVEGHSSLSEEGGKQGGRVRRVWDSYRIGSADLDSLRGKLTFHTSTISMFLISLEGSAIGRMERLLEKIAARVLQEEAVQAQQSQISLVSTASSVLEQIETHEDDVWARLKDELLVANVSSAHIMAHREEIIEYIKSLLANGVPTGDTMPARNERLVSVEAVLEAASSAEENWRSQGKAKVDRVMKLPSSVAVTSIPASISEDRPFGIQHWEKGGARIITNITTLRHGTFEGIPSCIIFLDVRFDATSRQPFMSANINCTPYDLNYNPISHSVPILEPRRLAGPSFTIERRTHIEMPVSGIAVGIPVTIEPFAGISKSSNTMYSQWKMEGYQGFQGSNATWTMTSDRQYGRGIPSNVRLGMIIRHAAKPILFRIEVKASMKSRWNQLTASSSGAAATTHPIEPVEGEQAFTAEDVRLRVESENLQQSEGLN